MHQPVSQLPARAAFSPELTRQAHLDGLRGVAALIVLFGHIMIALFPAVVTQNPNEAHTRFDQLGGFLPIGFIWNGNFGVCIFFVLSGYVLSAYAVQTRVSFLADLLRRYLRLALPVVIISTCAWLMLTLGAFSNFQAAVAVTKSGWLSGWYRFEPNFLVMAKEALYGAFASGQNTYNSNLWTMGWELPGSVYVFLCWALFKDRGIRLVALALFTVMHITDYFVLFAAGVLLYDRGADFVALPLRSKWTAKRAELIRMEPRCTRAADGIGALCSRLSRRWVARLAQRTGRYANDQYGRHFSDIQPRGKRARNRRDHIVRRPDVFGHAEAGFRFPGTGISRANIIRPLSDQYPADLQRPCVGRSPSPERYVVFMARRHSRSRNDAGGPDNIRAHLRFCRRPDDPHFPAGGAVVRSLFCERCRNK